MFHMPKRARDFMVTDLDQTIRQWDVLLEPNTSLEEALKPEFWSNVAHKCTKDNILWVRTQDDAWEGIFRVKAVEEKALKVVPLLYKNMSEETMAEPQSLLYEVRFRGPKKWGIMRKSDHEMVLENIDTKKQAVEELIKLEAA